MALGGLGAALGDIIRPAHGEFAGEQEDLFLIAAQPGPERVSGVVPVVPVPQPVVDDPGRDRGVGAFAQVIEDLLVQGGVPAGAGGLDGLMSVAEDRDDLAGPVLQAAGADLQALPRILWSLTVCDAGPVFAGLTRRDCRGCHDPGCAGVPA